ncbi:MAG: peptidoglycan binding domain-containing protein, partial [Lachnospiraceae bacterium]|nr:peptidoglycan binding domain-containing protein [Candidatus Equihabitans merdae]
MKLLDWNRNGKVDAADIVLSIMMLALLGAIAAYFIGMAHFGDKIDPGTKVSIEGREYNIGGMTADAAEDKLLKELAFDLTINGRTDSYKIKASDVEELRLEGNTPAEIIASEDAWRYGSGTKFEKVIEAGVVRTVDEDAVGKLVDKFSEVSAKAEQPKDAYIDGDGNHFWIVKEEEGAALDPKKTVAAICEAIENGQSELDLDKADCYKHPAVYEDNEALVSEWRRVEHFFTQKLSLNMTGAVEAITEEQLRDWCTYDMSTGELTVDEEKVAVFTEKLAETYNTFKAERPFKTHSGKTIT